MKLKTLKDMKTYNVDVCNHNPPYENCCCGDADTIRIDELRPEAIKWVKNCNCEFRTFPGICFACRRFKEFFNLTEEDLKEDLDDLPVTNCPLKKEIKK